MKIMKFQKTINQDNPHKQSKDYEIQIIISTDCENQSKWE